MFALCLRVVVVVSVTVVVVSVRVVEVMVHPQAAKGVCPRSLHWETSYPHVRSHHPLASTSSYVCCVLVCLVCVVVVGVQCTLQCT